jgi:hypothetical protein
MTRYFSRLFAENISVCDGLLAKGVLHAPGEHVFFRKISLAAGVATLSKHEKNENWKVPSLRL